MRRHVPRIIPILQDNFAFLFRVGNFNLCIDPGDADPIIKAIETSDFPQLDFILNTHLHADHVQGNDKLADRFNAKILSPPLPEQDYRLNSDVSFRILSTPGHTENHVCFWFKQDQVLFTGDTLFSLGCGRAFFSIDLLFQSLKKLKDLIPPETRIFCGHEYTLSNAKFALHVDPENSHLKAVVERVSMQRMQNLPSIPSLFQDELDSNPFLRCDQTNIKIALELDSQADPQYVFRRLRQIKDHFPS